MSAIYEEPDGANEPVKVLITLHDGMDTLDVAGPLEVFSSALHDKKNPGMLADRAIGDKQTLMKTFQRARPSASSSLQLEF